MQAGDISALIEEGIPGADALVLSDDNTHFEARVVAADFADKRPIQRHQMIYACLGERMGEEIHALSIRAYTPEEWARTGA